MKIKGFTLIELVIVIVLIGVLAVVAAPKFISLSKDARVAALTALKGEMQGTIDLVKIKARLNGLRPAAENPGGSSQTEFLVDFGYGASEVDWRNLCPEARAELSDSLVMADYLNLSEEFLTRETNRYALIGLELPASGTPTDEGCYILYDSFGFPDCTLTLVTADC
ncbi:prepilin-type N-terminal cleavage/methylation domain-containing protein [Alteromonas sediminis]|uniref:Prepilin-type N-terminal cleavage/methylation domain-containing protein n=1 Tax=Alteromonas sediminis TaxID=2259342 RepID=A0A3N5YKA6_9ALTE|nr:prepilin-type N-terminal cleavage/methylation domain-containing protein [Alteromonas sediminis]RPJ65281.1 prepilin-type N-terminal cleavage/methylation domain-containing protein [Alteromonas sediminis]